MADTITTKLSDDPADYLTGPTSGDQATEGGTTRDGGVAKFRNATTVRPVDTSDDSSDSGS